MSPCIYPDTDPSSDAEPGLRDYIARHARIEGMEVDRDSSAPPSPISSEVSSVPEPMNVTVAQKTRNHNSSPTNHDSDVIYISDNDDSTGSPILRSPRQTVINLISSDESDGVEDTKEDTHDEAMDIDDAHLSRTSSADPDALPISDRSSSPASFTRPSPLTSFPFLLSRSTVTSLGQAVPVTEEELHDFVDALMDIEDKCHKAVSTLFAATGKRPLFIPPPALEDQEPLTLLLRHNAAIEERNAAVYKWVDSWGSHPTFGRIVLSRFRYDLTVAIAQIELLIAQGGFNYDLTGIRRLNPPTLDDIAEEPAGTFDLQCYAARGFHYDPDMKELL